VGLTRSFNFEDARGRVDGETVALGIVFAGHPPALPRRSLGLGRTPSYVGPQEI